MRNLDYFLIFGDILLFRNKFLFGLDFCTKFWDFLPDYITYLCIILCLWNYSKSFVSNWKRRMTVIVTFQIFLFYGRKETEPRSFLWTFSQRHGHVFGHVKTKIYCTKLNKTKKFNLLYNTGRWNFRLFSFRLKVTILDGFSNFSSEDLF